MRGAAPLLLVVVAVAAVAAPGATAARPPTLAEREAITLALPKHFRDAPVECVWINIRISRNSRYAWVDAAFFDRPRCALYAHNGMWIMKKKAGTWRRIFAGSDYPPCKLRVPRDLTPCSPR